MVETAAPTYPKVLRDPVHNLITIPREDRALFLGLIDSPEFQRLRRIRQLGLSFLVYPGAEHSRWGHGLGVQHVARRMLDTLQDRYRDRPEHGEAYEELKRYRREILVTALLHDLGHGPFSHLFEKVVPSPTNPPAGYPKDHEEWTERIIRERFSDHLVKHGVDVDVVTGLVNKKDRRNLLAKDFISSQLDADRMDYLLRDSHATGPKYGEFDLAWLLHSLRIGKVEVRGKADGDWRLCFDSGKAVHVIEEYIQAREFMYEQVYVHKTTRAYEAMLRHILGLAARICDGNPGSAPLPCPPALAKMLAGQPVSTADYLSLDDFRLWGVFADWSQLPTGGHPLVATLRNKCGRLVNRGRPYRTIDLLDDDMRERAVEFMSSLKGTPQEFSCHRDAFVDVAYRNAFYRKSHEALEEADRVIHLVDRQGRTRSAESESSVIRAISDIPTRIHRLYYDDADSAMIKQLKDESWEVAEPVRDAGQEKQP